MKKPSPSFLKKLGVAFLPEDRHDVLFNVRSLRENLTVVYLRKIVKQLLPGIGFLGEKDIASNLVNRFKIVNPGIERPISNLSGGNQQKSLLARWLAFKPDILILDDPTRGVDIGVKEEIYLLMRKLAEEGVSIIFISSDLTELLLVCHRILILREGRIVSEFQREKFDRHEIVKYIAFQKEGA